MVSGPTCRSGTTTALAYGGLLLTTACEFQKITLPPSEPVLVVQSVLNTADTMQFVVVENSRSGAEAIPPALFPGLIPDFPAQKGLSGAVVTLTHRSPPTGCPQSRVTLTELPPFDDFGVPEPITTGVYVTTDLCALHPGDSIDLEVTAPDGRRVTGSTRIPGIDRATVRSAGTETEPLPMARHRDTLAIAVDASFADALQVDVIRQDRIAPTDFDFPFSLITDAMAVDVPGDRVLADEGSDNFPLFDAGRFYVVGVSATDRHYFDYARSGGDVFTGRGFINHLEGGIGVFGSLTPVTRRLRVTGPRTDPREGAYRMRGMVDGAPVDMTFEPYRLILPERFGGPGTFAALLEGDWRGQMLAVSVEGAFDGDPFFRYGSWPISFTLYVREGDTVIEYSIWGEPTDYSQPFALVVATNTPTPIGELRLERLE